MTKSERDPIEEALEATRHSPDRAKAAVEHVLSREPSNVLRQSMIVIRARELAGELEKRAHWPAAEIVALLHSLADEAEHLRLDLEGAKSYVRDAKRDVGKLRAVVASCHDLDPWIAEQAGAYEVMPNLKEGE